jgi:peptidoglycan/LPS O-acetylase OafA/YrhL
VRRDIPSLTGLRFLAAFFVMYAHTTTMMGVGPHSYLGIVANVSNLGMSLFFVLSGFVIQWNYGAMTKDGWRGVYNFAVARFARLYPLYALFLVAFIGVSPRGGEGHYMLSIATYLTLTQSWFPVVLKSGETLSNAYLANAWSISTELLFISHSSQQVFCSYEWQPAAPLWPSSFCG